MAASKKNTRSKTPKTPKTAKSTLSHKTTHLSLRLRESVLIIGIALSGYLLSVLIGLQTTTNNNGGSFGFFIAHSLMAACGYLAFLIPLALLYASYLIFRTAIFVASEAYPKLLWRLIGFSFTLLSLCSIFDIGIDPIQHSISAGGYLGAWFCNLWFDWFGLSGSIVILITLFLTGISLFTGLSWLKAFEYLGKGLLLLILSTIALIIHCQQRWKNRKIARTLAQAPKASKPTPQAFDKKIAAISVPPKIMPSIKVVEPSARATLDRQATLFKHLDNATLPSLTLLDPPDPVIRHTVSAATLELVSRDVEARLLEFGIEVQVVAVHPGPVITRFEMQLAPGIKVSRISTLAKDLARSLSVTSVRIVDVIPGKTTVGLEVPNEHREIVRLSEVLASQPYDQAKSPLSLALGKDISGNPVIVDLAKMPHLLVAGTTGSGKSVGLNAMILSLLFKATPSEVRLIMIDPKMLELSIYEGIPHLLTPVVTDMREAANALRWCVAEMDRRYKLMAALGVRNLSSYNGKVLDAEKAATPLIDPLWKPTGQPGETPSLLSTLPWVVVIVDEFADMIMVVGKKVEELIARIAQKARAAGIHMILATQRPSVDVITGLIKANVPTRIAFQVSSRIDSRTILDQQGAEQLLGHGDMLYLAPGTGLPIRVHGAFVDDPEVHRVVADWRSRGEPEYLLDVSVSYDPADMESDATGNSEADPLYDQAVQIVLESRRASISNLQRRLKVGYNRSARLIEAMEAAGLVSAMESNGNRQVLVPER